jgi:hypothetical protein
MTGATCAFVSVATCAVLLLLALVFFVARRVNPCSFRLSVALVRVFSFTVEMDASSRRSREVSDRRDLPNSGRGPRPYGRGQSSMDTPNRNGSVSYG